MVDKNSLVLCYPDISKLEATTSRVGENGLKFFVI